MRSLRSLLLARGPGCTEVEIKDEENKELEAGLAAKEAAIILKLRLNQERIQEVERELVAFRRFHGAHQRVQEARCAAAGARRR